MTRQKKCEYCTALQFIQRGELLVIDADNFVVPAKDDNSEKARFYRWFGRCIHLKKLAKYGLNEQFIIGSAVSDAVYDDFLKTYKVEITL